MVGFTLKLLLKSGVNIGQREIFKVVSERFNY